MNSPNTILRQHDPGAHTQMNGLVQTFELICFSMVSATLIMTSLAPYHNMSELAGPGGLTASLLMQGLPLS